MMNNHRGLICAALSGTDSSKLCAEADQASPYADLFEVRLDSLIKPDIADCCRSLKKPLLFTNRAAWEGGSFGGTEEERLDLLLQAVQAGCAYVDIELKTEEAFRSRLIAAAANAGTKVIVSSHDFEKTPSTQNLLEIVEKMQATGAYAGKIVTMAKTSTDVVRMLNLLDKAQQINFPLTAFCMGELGRISRMASVYLGGFMTYVAPNDEQGTAPGQFAADHFHALVQLFENNAD